MDLPTAVRASMCVPDMFRSVVMDGQQHADGLLVQNHVVEAVRSLDIAVEVCTEVSRRNAN